MLQELRLHQYGNEEPFSYSEEFIRTSTEAVCSLGYLRSVDTGPIIPRALIHLASLDSLVRLSIHLGNLDYKNILSQSPNCLHFRGLRQLSVVTSAVDDEIQATLSFLDAIRAEHLDTIHMKFWILYDNLHRFANLNHGGTPSPPSIPTPSKMRQLFDAFSRLSSLETIEFDDTRLIKSQLLGRRYMMDEDTISPLYKLKSLSRLQLRAVPFHLTSSAIPNLALAWPNIREMELGQKCFALHVELTVEDLLPFAKHCPKLETLGILINMERPGIGLSSRPTAGQSVSALKMLHLGWSKPTHPDHVAACLSGMFPEADITCDFFVADAWYQLYERLRALKHAFVLIGEQERRAVVSQECLESSGASHGIHLFTTHSLYLTHIKCRKSMERSNVPRSATFPGQHA